MALMKSTMKMIITICHPKLKGLLSFANGLPTCPYMIALATSDDPLLTPIHIKLFS